MFNPEAMGSGDLAIQISKSAQLVASAKIGAGKQALGSQQIGKFAKAGAKKLTNSAKKKVDEEIAKELAAAHATAKALAIPSSKRDKKGMSLGEVQLLLEQGLPMGQKGAQAVKDGMKRLSALGIDAPLTEYENAETWAAKRAAVLNPQANKKPPSGVTGPSLSAPPPLRHPPPLHPPRAISATPSIPNHSPSAPPNSTPTPQWGAPRPTVSPHHPPPSPFPLHPSSRK